MCLMCHSNQDVHTYPCGKKFCWPCIVDYTFAMLKIFSYKLQQDLESIQGKASYLSCLHDCGECKISMSLRTVENYLESSRLVESDKMRFRELSIIGRSFFSGIKTKFYRCLNCKEFSSSIEENPFLCKGCIISLIHIRSGILPKSINYRWISTNEEIMNSEYMGENFEIMYYNEAKQSYDYYPFKDHFGNDLCWIPKVKNIRDNQFILIVRLIYNHLSDSEKIVIESHNYDIKIITCVEVML